MSFILYLDHLNQPYPIVLEVFAEGSGRPVSQNQISIAINQQ